MYSRSARPRLPKYPWIKLSFTAAQAPKHFETCLRLKGTWSVWLLGQHSCTTNVLFFWSLWRFAGLPVRPFCCVHCRALFAWRLRGPKWPQRPQHAPTFGDPVSCNPSNSVDTLWLVVWNMFFPHILGISSSQLTFTPSFFRGVGWNHQPALTRCHSKKWSDSGVLWMPVRPGWWIPSQETATNLRYMNLYWCANIPAL